MANVTSTQILVDGPRNVAVKFVATLDAGNLAPQTLLDVATLAVADLYFNTPPKNLLFLGVEYVISDGLYVNLTWDGATPAPLLALSGRGEINQAANGLIPNNALTPNGKVLISTVGLTVGPTVAITLIANFVKTSQ